MKKRMVKKMVAEILAVSMLAGMLSGCTGYQPQTSGKGESASGSAVLEETGNAWSEQQKEREKQAEKLYKKKDLENSKYFWMTSLRYFSSRYFYGTETTSQTILYQISPDCNKRKKTGICVDSKQGYLSLISVDCNFVYYSIGNAIYRTPIITKNDSEKLDVTKTECLVKKCMAESDVVVSGQKLYYTTVSNLSVRKEKSYYEVTGKRKYHSLDLVTKEKKDAKGEIPVVTYTADKKENTEKNLYDLFDGAEHIMTKDNIYIISEDTLLSSFYRLNRQTMELTLLDEFTAADSVDELVDDWEWDISDSGNYIWYTKVGEKKREAYSLYRYDTKQNKNRMVADGKTLLQMACKGLGIKKKEVDSFDEMCFEACGDDFLLFEYTLAMKVDKGIRNYRSGVMMYSCVTEQFITFPELDKFYNKYTESLVYESILEQYPMAEMDCYLPDSKQILVYAEFVSEEDGEGKDKYAVYDIGKDVCREISEKKFDKLESQWEKKEVSYIEY